MTQLTDAAKYHLNTAIPRIMYIDMDSCFATAEQQANPLLRGKPMAVAAYASANGCILSASVEAKKFGVKTGMRVKEGRELCPQLVVRAPDPNKYRFINDKLCAVFQHYTPFMTPKSIDEAVLDLENSPYHDAPMLGVGAEIKRRIKKEVGEWINCSVGIGTNRNLAKLAASISKPNGLLQIDHTNLVDTYKRIKLADFCGIGSRMEARLNMAGIFTPMEFLEATLLEVKKQVFKSIVGYYWYQRLRGWEVDRVEFGRKSFSHQYALQKQTDDPKELGKLLMKLCEKTGRRLRGHGYTARGIFIGCIYSDGTYWGEGKKVHNDLYSTVDIYLYAQRLLNKSFDLRPAGLKQPQRKKVRQMHIGCFELAAVRTEEQLPLFPDNRRKIADTADKVNDKYGEFTVAPALMMGMDGTILDRIAFGKSGLNRVGLG